MTMRGSRDHIAMERTNPLSQWLFEAALGMFDLFTVYLGERLGLSPARANGNDRNTTSATLQLPNAVWRSTKTPIRTAAATAQASLRVSSCWMYRDGTWA